MSHPPAARIPLTFVALGTQARIAEIDPAVAEAQRQQLAAYGVSPERGITVLQQRPMTVILADEVELALEAAVARHIWVDGGAPLTDGSAAG